MICKYCNKEINNDEKFCHHCGAKVLDDYEQDTYTDFINQQNQPESNMSKVIHETSTSETLGVIAKVFMILSCISMGFYLLPLLWTIPMTISLSRKLKNKEPIGVGFKICTLLFCNMIAGILLLCRNENENLNN